MDGWIDSLAVLRFERESLYSICFREDGSLVQLTANVEEGASTSTSTKSSIKKALITSLISMTKIEVSI